MNSDLVTIIGGSGQIGRQLVSELISRGKRVLVAVRHPSDARPILTSGTAGQISIVQANIRDDTSILAALDGSDTAINLVGVLRNGGNQTLDALHHLGAARVARLAAIAKLPKLVHVSALGARADSRSQYSRSKAAGEAAALGEYPALTIVRPNVVFGPDDHFFNRFGGLAKMSPVLPIIVRSLSDQDGPLFQPIFVGDVAVALAEIIDRADCAGSIFELSGPETFSMREILERVNEYTGRDRMLVPVLNSLAAFGATFLQMVPFVPISRDEFRMLEIDTVASEDFPGLAELGVLPTSVDSVVPAYLARYRRARAAVA